MELIVGIKRTYIEEMIRKIYYEERVNYLLYHYMSRTHHLCHLPHMKLSQGIQGVSQNKKTVNIAKVSQQ